MRSNVADRSLSAAAIRAAGSVGGYIDSLEAQGIRPGAGDERLRLWGLKFLLDGGVEAGALERPYADRPGYRGELLWDREDLVRAFATCVRRGWPAGTHAFGDRAVALVLSAIRGAHEQAGPVPAGTLVVEHGGLIGDHISDAVDLGVHITVQQGLLEGLGAALMSAWGAERTAALFPWQRAHRRRVHWIGASTDRPPSARWIRCWPSTA